jgi:septal ring factor EnvC (AmiA/AmiB activator)
MTGKELIACIALVVITCFIIAALLGSLREASQAQDDIWNHDIHEAILRDRLEKQKEASRQLVAELKKLREENTRLCKECVVLRHGEQEKEEEDEQKERSEKV